MRSVLCLVAFAGSACGDTRQAHEPPAPAAAEPVARAEETPRRADVDAAPPVPVLRQLDGGDDESAALVALGALPAWSAVIERDRLLARRGERGVVFGRLGRPTGDSGARWLHDETEGRGSLAIRVSIAADLPVAPGDRLALWGAWQPSAGSWVFVAERAETLLPATDRSPPEQPPLQVADGSVSEQATLVSQRTKPGLIVFTVLGRPARFGDGWPIADRADQPPVARLFLPGERRPYGAQIPPTPDEWWTLDIGATYEVEVGRFRPPRPAGGPIALYAVGPPSQVTLPAAY